MIPFALIALGSLAWVDAGWAAGTEARLSARPARRGVLAAMRHVESGGNDRAVGDAGRSRGPLQCGRAAWNEACRYGRVKWDYDRLAWSYPHSARVVGWYAARWGAKTDEQVARIWNGGPGGAKKRATLSYWRQVQKVLVRITRKRGVASRGGAWPGKAGPGEAWLG